MRVQGVSVFGTEEGGRGLLEIGLDGEGREGGEYGGGLLMLELRGVECGCLAGL